MVPSGETAAREERALGEHDERAGQHVVVLDGLRELDRRLRVTLGDECVSTGEVDRPAEGLVDLGFECRVAGAHFARAHR